MKLSAIVYVSNTGHTRQYALLLAKESGLPVFSYDEAISGLPGGSRIIYMGWIHASHVKGYSGAAKRFSVCAVCGVGLCDTGTLITEVRKTTSIPEDIPLFTLQGGFDRSKLRFEYASKNPVGGKVYRISYNKLIKSSCIKNRYPQLEL